MEVGGGWSVGAIRGLPITMYAPTGTRSHIKYIFIAYHMQKRRAGVQKACMYKCRRIYWKVPCLFFSVSLSDHFINIDMNLVIQISPFADGSLTIVTQNNTCERTHIHTYTHLVYTRICTK